MVDVSVGFGKYLVAIVIEWIPHIEFGPGEIRLQGIGGGECIFYQFFGTDVITPGAVRVLDGLAIIFRGFVDGDKREYFAGYEVASS